MRFRRFLTLFLTMALVVFSFHGGAVSGPPNGVIPGHGNIGLTPNATAREAYKTAIMLDIVEQCEGLADTTEVLNELQDVVLDLESDLVSIITDNQSVEVEAVNCDLQAVKIVPPPGALPIDDFVGNMEIVNTGVTEASFLLEFLGDEGQTKFMRVQLSPGESMKIEDPARVVIVIVILGVVLIIALVTQGFTGAIPPGAGGFCRHVAGSFFTRAKCTGGLPDCVPAGLSCKPTGTEFTTWFLTEPTGCSCLAPGC